MLLRRMVDGGEVIDLIRTRPLKQMAQGWGVRKTGMLTTHVRQYSLAWRNGTRPVQPNHLVP